MTVYQWSVVDESNRLRDCGCAPTYEAAMYAARRSEQQQGPDRLLDMLELRRL